MLLYRQIMRFIEKINKNLDETEECWEMVNNLEKEKKQAKYFENSVQV